MAWVAGSGHKPRVSQKANVTNDRQIATSAAAAVVNQATKRPKPRLARWTRTPASRERRVRRSGAALTSRSSVAVGWLAALVTGATVSLVWPDRDMDHGRRGSE